MARKWAVGNWNYPKSRMNPLAGRSATRNFGLPPFAAASASAAPYPLRTAPSMVEGQPVAVQSPAMNNLGHGLVCDGRYASLPGAGEKVAWTSLITVALVNFASR